MPGCGDERTGRRRTTSTGMLDQRISREGVRVPGAGTQPRAPSGVIEHTKETPHYPRNGNAASSSESIRVFDVSTMLSVESASALITVVNSIAAPAVAAGSAVTVGVRNATLDCARRRPLRPSSEPRAFSVASSEFTYTAGRGVREGQLACVRVGWW